MLRLIHPSQLESTRERLRTNMMKTYETKEDVILDKHNISKEEYTMALQVYAE